MGKTVPILVANRPEEGNEWRRFVAVLCFIEFYVEFVEEGGYFVWLFTEGWGDAPLSDERVLSILRTGVGLLRAFAFFLYGRALWLGRPSTTHWLVRAVALSLAMIALAGVGATIGPVPQGNVFVGRFVNVTGRVLVPALASAEHGLWLALLVVGWWHLRRRQRGKHVRSRTWVTLAATWWIGVVILSPIGAYTSIGAWALPPEFPGWAYIGHHCLLLLGTACLLMHWRLARTLALIAANTEIVAALIVVWNLGRMVHAGITCELLQIPAPVPLSLACQCFVNDNAFWWLCVHSVGVAGPFLLIAIYAWRVPMAALPEDGSPYPRRFCGKCRYNLHGLDGHRCPECGSELEAAGLAVAASSSGDPLARESGSDL